LPLSIVALTVVTGSSPHLEKFWSFAQDYVNLSNIFFRIGISLTAFFDSIKLSF
jgi:hypothetical protein